MKRSLGIVAIFLFCLSLSTASFASNEGYYAYVETLKLGEVEIDYVQVDGLLDETAQNILNENLQLFSTWVYTANHEGQQQSSIIGKVGYAFIGNEAISVYSEQEVFEKEAAYPVSYFYSSIFSLKTGEAEGTLTDYVKVGSELRNAILSGVFVQTHPDVRVEDAEQELVTYIIDNPIEYETRFYLTETSLGLYLPDQLHALGDYWAFEAKYEDIKPLLTNKLLSTLGLQ